MVDGLGDLLDDLGLYVDSVKASNPYEMFRHYRERTEDDWQVYEYRNVEGSIHADVCEYPDSGLYVVEPIEEEDLSEE